MPRKAQPYSRVLQGSRKPEARTKYLAFLAGTADRPSRIGTKGKRPPSIKLAVDLFGFSLPENVEQLCSASKAAVVVFQTLTSVNTRTHEAAATDNSPDISLTVTGAAVDVIKDARVTPARFIRKVYESATATAKASETTGLKYGYRKSSSLSMPFGKANATDSQSDAFAAISAQVLGAAQKPELTVVNLVPELI